MEEYSRFYIIKPVHRTYFYKFVVNVISKSRSKKRCMRKNTNIQGVSTVTRQLKPAILKHILSRKCVSRYDVPMSFFLLKFLKKIPFYAVSGFI